jgi:hypothetical protein
MGGHCCLPIVYHGVVHYLTCQLVLNLDCTSDQLTVEIRPAGLLLQSDFCLLQSTPRYFE